MKATAELSLYPLDESYAKIVTEFIKKLRSHPGLEVQVNGLSTQIFGSFDDIMETIRRELPSIWQEHPSVLIVKLAAGHLKKEDLPKEIQ